MRKWLVSIVILAVAGICVLPISKYLIKQGVGQIAIIFNTTSFTEANLTPTERHKVALIQEIKSFAEREIELTPTRNYSTYYDQHNKPIIWLVTASEKFKLTPYYWNYPILGELNYKGFFDEQDAKNEANRLKEKGLDVEIGNVNAWSTLGYLNDPILSSMLEKTEFELVRLIIHELTHSTIFLPDSTTFNENLATFIGDKGAELYIVDKYGLNSSKHKEFTAHLQDLDTWGNYWVSSANQLDSLYNSFPKNLSEEEKQQKKQEMLNSICENSRKLPLNDTSKFSINPQLKETINNAYFIDYLLYRSTQHDFEEQYTNVYNSDLTAFIESYK